MEEKKHSDSSREHADETPKDMYDIDIQACSATDCTGLIPSLPQSEAEEEAYEDIYPYITKARVDHQ